MSPVAVVARETVRDIIRRKLFLIFLAIAMLVFGITLLVFYFMNALASTASSAELGLLSRRSSVMVAGIWWGLGTYGFVAVVFAIVWSDWKRGVVAMLLTKSATRTQMILGKMAGVFLVMVAYGLFGSLLTLGVGAILGQADSMLLIATLEGFLSLALQVSVVFAFACAFDLALGIVLWFLFGFAKAILVILEQASESLPALGAVTWLHYFFPVTETFRTAQAFVEQEPLEASLWSTLLPYLHAADYSVLMLLAAVWVFNRRTLPLK